jgi:anti-sigma regulatory factor (Ser/Thr protein kinase)
MLAFDRDGLGEARRLVARRAAEAGLAGARAQDLVLAVGEAAANSVRHAGGHGVLRVWEDDGAVVCEVKDPGRVRDPLAGRHLPALDDVGGWGLYIAHQVCDLVQLRSGPQGTVVRMRMRVAGTS